MVTVLWLISIFFLLFQLSLRFIGKTESDSISSGYFTADHNEEISTNMEGEALKLLSKAMKNMFELIVNTLSFEQKLQALMGECKEGLIKKDGDSGKKSLMEWRKACHTSNEESWVVITMKVQAVEAGIKLCNLVIDFVFMMSRQKELAANIGKFKSALKWVTEDGNFNSMVINKVLTILEMVDRELSEMKRSQEVKNKGEPAIDDGNREKRSNGRIRVNERLDQLLEEILYQIFDEFIEAALRLESIISHRNLPAESQMSMKEALSRLECGLKQCEEVLEGIRKDIKTLRKWFPFKLELKDAKTTKTRKLVASKICELWRGLQDSAEQELQESRETEVEVKREGKRPSKGCCCC